MCGADILVRNTARHPSKNRLHGTPASLAPILRGQECPRYTTCCLLDLDYVFRGGGFDFVNPRDDLAGEIEKRFGVG